MVGEWPDRCGAIDARVEIAALFATDDEVVQAGRTRGTIRASGVRFDVAEVHRWRIRTGRAVRAHFAIDTEAMLAALAAAAEACPACGFVWVSVPVEAFPQLEVSVMVRGQGLRGAGGARGIVFFLDADGQLLRGVGGGVALFRWSGSFDWRQDRNVVQVPAGAVRARKSGRNCGRNRPRRPACGSATCALPKRCSPATRPSRAGCRGCRTWPPPCPRTCCLRD